MCHVFKFIRPLHTHTHPLHTSHTPQSCVLSYPTPPPSPPPPTEPTHPHTFTASQLLALHSQLASVSPDGYLLASTLVDTLVGLAERSNLPDLWSTLSRQQVHVHQNKIMQSAPGNDIVLLECFVNVDYFAKIKNLYWYW